MPLSRSFFPARNANTNIQLLDEHIVKLCTDFIDEKLNKHFVKEYKFKITITDAISHDLIIKIQEHYLNADLKVTIDHSNWGFTLTLQ